MLEDQITTVKTKLRQLLDENIDVCDEDWYYEIYQSIQHLESCLMKLEKLGVPEVGNME